MPEAAVEMTAEQNAQATAEREAKFQPLGYLNTETDQMVFGENDPVMNRFTYRDNQGMDGVSRFSNLRGDGTMIVPTADMKALDAKRRRNVPLWLPIFDQAVMDKYVARDYEKVDDKQEATVAPPTPIPSDMAPPAEEAEVTQFSEEIPTGDEAPLEFSGSGSKTFEELNANKPKKKAKKKSAKEK